MKAVSTSFDDVFPQLELWGSERVRMIYARQEAGENQFGIAAVLQRKK
ncbi:MAG: hypothetical protein L0Z50_23420 [Verrucomicrobiales bacterium]|nr:hypothetical protein [Verrucomicrobiales bacterium]